MDIEGSCELNFYLDPKTYDTKYIPSEDNPVIVCCLDRMDKRDTDVKSTKIKYGFSSFRYPDIKNLFNVDREGEIDHAKTVIVSVDNSFDIPLEYVSINHVFIDHHAFEQMTGKPDYTSNSEMVYKNYILIYKILSKVILNKEIINIGIVFHTDLDGIGSGLMIGNIINHILNDDSAIVDNDELGIARVIGEYGDISTNKESVLIEIFKPKSNIVPGLKKKFEIISKNMSRYFKAIRPIIDIRSTYYPDKDKHSDLHLKLVNKYNSLYNKYRLNYELCENSYLKILEFFNNLINCNVTNFDTIKLMSMISLDSVNRDIIVSVQQEIDFGVNSYLKPETPQIDTVVKFTNIGFPTKYKLLFVDTPYDIGRSIMWTYMGRLKYFKEELDDKRFSLANYRQILPEFIVQNTRIACYNIFDGKLSLNDNGNTNTAFEIGKAFGGGGHGNTENGSIGSVYIDFKTLKENIDVVNII